MCKLFRVNREMKFIEIQVNSVDWKTEKGYYICERTIWQSYEVCNMRKLKVYLDTSVISHLLQEDVPEKMAGNPSVLLESEG